MVDTPAVLSKMAIYSPTWAVESVMKKPGNLLKNTPRKNSFRVLKNWGLLAQQKLQNILAVIDVQLI